jgi:HD-like signal output (HDOD) protein
MKQTVLFVDDDRTLLTGLQRMLRPMRAEWETIFISDPTEAVRAIKDTCFDVVVTDMRMPSIDGARLLGEVRNVCPHSVRIVLSGQAEIDVVLRAVQHAHQYISKPCEADVLKEIIRQACNLKGAIGSVALKEFIAQVRCLPVDLDAAQEVLRMLEGESQDKAAISALISSDLGMSSKLFQLVNSSFFTSIRAPSCNDAVNLLGLDLLRRLVLEQNIFSGHVGSHLSQDLVRLLNDHGRRVSALTKDYVHADQNRSRMLDEYETAAFFHDIGRLVLATFDPEKYCRLSEQSFSAWDELLISEREIFGASHEEVGAYFLRLWGFGESIVDAASGHHSAGGGVVGEVLGIVKAIDQVVHKEHPVEPVM